MPPLFNTPASGGQPGAADRAADASAAALVSHRVNTNEMPTALAHVGYVPCCSFSLYPGCHMRCVVVVAEGQSCVGPDSIH